MNASALVEALQSLIARHGDLPMTVVTGKYEYAASAVNYAAEGPLPFLVAVQGQHPPERLVVLTTPKLAATQSVTERAAATKAAMRA